MFGSHIKLIVHKGSRLTEIFPSYSQTFMLKNYVGNQILFVDVGYLDNDSYDVLQPTAWIPFLDTNEINGCMQVHCGFFYSFLQDV